MALEAKKDWSAEVAEFKGNLVADASGTVVSDEVSQSCTLDGVQYEYRAVFDMDEDIDDFLKTHEERMVKCDVTFVDEQLTFFFSTKQLESFED